jgi:hypothetical protein
VNIRFSKGRGRDGAAISSLNGENFGSVSSPGGGQVCDDRLLATVSNVMRMLRLFKLENRRNVEKLSPHASPPPVCDINGFDESHRSSANYLD